VLGRFRPIVALQHIAQAGCLTTALLGGAQKVGYSKSAKLAESPSMLTVRPALPDIIKLKAAAILLKAAYKTISQAGKTIDAAKADIAQWLKANRDIDLETLPIGEMVNVEGVCLIERAKQNKFDEGAFFLKHADLHTQFKKDFPITKFKVLVSEQ
jgi:hypothetical protein